MRNIRAMFFIGFTCLVGSTAYAVPVTYTLTGTGSYSADAVTYTTADDFLSFGSTVYTGSSTGKLDFFDTPITGLGFLSDVSYEFVDNYGDGEEFDATAYSLTALNTTQNLGDATLTITKAATTPEPASLALLCTGALALFSVQRRRAL